MANIIGEVFDRFVTQQVEARQTLLGYSQEGNTINDSVNQWLHNNSAWTRMISGIDIRGPRAAERLVSLNLGADYASENLAKNFILYNGVSSVTGSGDSLSFNPSTNNQDYFAANSDFSITNSYGFAGLDQGLRPMPGIESVRVSYVNKGALANAEIDIIAFNKEQLNIIDTLFLHPGYSFLLEWGWTRYIDNDTATVIHNDPTSLITDPFKSILSKKSTQYTIYNEIKKEKQKQSGNYDALYLIVKNFKFTFQPNGTYKITVYAVTQGDLLENLKINTVSPGEGALGAKQQLLDQDQRNKTVEDLKAELALNESKIAEKAKELQALETAFEEYKRKNVLLINTPKYKEVVAASVPTIEELRKEVNDLKGRPTEIRNEIITLTGEDIEATNVVDRLANKSRIHLELKRVRDYLQGNTGGASQDILSMKVEKIEKTKTVNEEGLIIETTDTANDFLYFMKLGNLLDFIQNNLLLYSTSKSNPYFRIDTNNNNYCFHFSKHISADPEICMIPVRDGKIAVPESYKKVRERPEKIAELQRKLQQQQKNVELAQDVLEINQSIENIGTIDFSPTTPGERVFNPFEVTKPNTETTEPAGFLDVIKEPTAAEQALTAAQQYLKSISTDLTSENKAASGSTDASGHPFYGGLPSTFQSNAGGGTTSRDEVIQEENLGRVFENIPVVFSGSAGFTGPETITIKGAPKEVEAYTINFPNSIRYITRSRYFQFGKKDNEPTNLTEQGSWTIKDGKFKRIPDKDKSTTPNLTKTRNADDIESGLTSQDLNTDFIVNNFIGRLMDIHVNLEYIATVANNNIDKQGNLSLISFLNQLLTGINAALGYCHDFQVIYDRETNYVKIYDYKILNYGGLKEKSNAPAFFNLFGFKPIGRFNYGSFIYDVNFTSQLTNDFVNMITIAAQSDTNVLGMDYTGLSKYNEGLVDRIISQKKSAAEIGSTSGGTTVKDLNNLYNTAKTFAQDIWGQLSINRGEVDAFMSANRDLANYEINNSVKNGLIPNPIVIPYNLSLTMMGLSGMKIFETFEVDDKILPPMYDNRSYNFIAKAISHTITNNKWTTTLESQIVNKSKNNEVIPVSENVEKYIRVVTNNGGGGGVTFQGLGSCDPEILKKVTPFSNLSSEKRKNAIYLYKLLKSSKFNFTESQARAIVSVSSKESNFKPVDEISYVNGNTKIKRIIEVWPKVQNPPLRNKVLKLLADGASDYSSGCYADGSCPKHIQADKDFWELFYGGLYGNPKGQAWRYIGRGYNGVTFLGSEKSGDGYAGYNRLYRELGSPAGQVDLVKNPEDLNKKDSDGIYKIAAWVAGLYFQKAINRHKSTFEGVKNDPEATIKYMIKANAGWGSAETGKIFVEGLCKAVKFYSTLPSSIPVNEVPNV
jgi:hypothetical protein